MTNIVTSRLLTDGECPKMSPLLKVCHTCPTMMRRGAVIPYLKKIKKLFESRDRPLEFC